MDSIAGESSLIQIKLIRDRRYYHILAETKQEMEEELTKLGYQTATTPKTEASLEPLRVSQDRTVPYEISAETSQAAGEQLDFLRQPLGSMKPRKTMDRAEGRIKKSRSLTGTLAPAKKEVHVTVTTRKQNIVSQLKQIYNDTCQICGERVEVGVNEFISEVHHIKPLGGHDGSDVIENMIVVWPNHHAMFDRGAITVDIKKRLVYHANQTHPLHRKAWVQKHRISTEYIEYHDRKLFKGYKAGVLGGGDTEPYLFDNV